MQPSGKFSSTGTKFTFCTIHIKWQPYQYLIWLPFFENFLNLPPVRNPIPCFKDSQRVSCFRQRLANSDTYLSSAKIKGKYSTCFSRNGIASLVLLLECSAGIVLIALLELFVFYACPTSVLSRSKLMPILAAAAEAR